MPELQKIARTFSIAIIGGVSEREGDVIYNTQVAIDSSGAIVEKYRKTHLFKPIEEDKCFAPGAELMSVRSGRSRLA